MKPIKRIIEDIKYRGKLYKVKAEDFYTTDKELNQELYIEQDKTVMDEYDGEINRRKVVKHQIIFENPQKIPYVMLKYLGNGIFEDIITHKKISHLTIEKINDRDYTLVPREQTTCLIGAKVNLANFLNTNKGANALPYTGENKKHIRKEFDEAEKLIQSGNLLSTIKQRNEEKKRREKEKADIEEKRKKIIEYQTKRIIHEVTYKFLENKNNNRVDYDRPLYDANRLFYGSYSDIKYVTEKSEPTTGIDYLDDGMPVDYTSYSTISYNKELGGSGIFYKEGENQYTDFVRDDKKIDKRIIKKAEFQPLFESSVNLELTKEEIIKLYEEISSRLKKDEFKTEVMNFVYGNEKSLSDQIEQLKEVKDSINESSTQDKESVRHK